MKSGKYGAFANSATGYGKKTHYANPSLKRSEKSAKSDLKCNKDDTKPKTNKAEEDEKDLNSGFGDYLRSSEGVEMMKMFIFANTIMLILTMAWPQVKLQYIWFMQWWDSLKEE
ncbi:exit protein of rhodopsin and TRP A [Haematobia irritans]|uniref:exit protein of rhodopsin and TRP A n=1 Tax=Haematobia irritans TaxID=7368 RepID=UPI003F50881B